MNSTSTSPVIRLIRLLRPHANPLTRGVDRLESLALVLAILLGLLLLPVMLVLGSLTHAALAEDAEREAQTRHEVVATLLADAPSASADSHGAATIAKSEVRATWQSPDGATHAGLVRADDGLRTGAQVTIWLDHRDGRVVDKPTSPAGADAGGFMAAGLGWLTAVGLLALAQFGIHRSLNRRRFRTWEQEWARVEPDWDTYRRR